MSAINSPKKTRLRTRRRAASDAPGISNLEIGTLHLSLSFPSSEVPEFHQLIPPSSPRSHLTASSSFSDFSEDISIFEIAGTDILIFEDHAPPSPSIGKSRSSPSPHHSRSQSPGPPKSIVSLVSAGNISGLIYNLANRKPQDQSYVDHFLLCYDYFIPAAQLLDELFSRFHTFVQARTRFEAGFDLPSDELISNSMKIATVVLLRLLFVLKRWIELRPYEFRPNSVLRNDLDDRLTHMLNSSSPQLVEWASSFRATLRYVHLAERNILPSTHGSGVSPRSHSSIPSRLSLSNSAESQLLYRFSPQDVAQQMMLVDGSLFLQITLHEFFQGTWTKEKDPSQAPHIVDLTERFNRVSYWIASEILSTPTPERRLHIISFFISVAEHCLELRNFNSAMQICSALTMNSVQRLKPLWSALSPVCRESFENISETFSGAENFKKYRQLLRSSMAPVLPFLGIFLQDITFALQNPAETADGLINFQRYSILGQVLIEFIQYQRSFQFSFPKIPELYLYLKNVEGLKEEQLFVMSRFLQGRAGPKSPSTSSIPQKTTPEQSRKPSLSSSSLFSSTSTLTGSSSQSSFASTSSKPNVSRRLSIFKKSHSRDL